MYIDMRKLLILLVFFCVFILAGQAKNLREKYALVYPSTVCCAPRTATEYPFVLAVPSWVRSAVVRDRETGAEIPSQLDDLDGDGILDELVFVFQPRDDGRGIEVEWSDEPAVAGRYPDRVHAQMFLRDGKEIVPQTVVSSTVDNMYNKLHHHGPAFESELIAYRIYFDKKQTVDIYGKYNPGLELTETLWYPTDEQLAAGFGDDVIRVFGSLSVGTLKGWDPDMQEGIHITPVARREARIVADGPVRTVVDMKVEGWEYRDRTIDLNTRYILYTGHRDVEVQGILGGDWQGLTFCTGVMKMAEHTAWDFIPSVSHANGMRVRAVWGTDFPVDDTVKYARQTVGLAVSVPGKYIKDLRSDSANELLEIVPDADGMIRYRFTAAAAKEHFGYRDAAQFDEYLRQWSAEIAPALVREE